MRSDYFKLKNLDAAAWSEELIVKEILRLFPFKHIFLEAATAKEYAELFPVPFTVCNYNADGENEWNIHGGEFPFESAGSNGGSSRSLQKRLLIYAYLAGAEFVGEEWGGYNTFYDLKDFTLSPYGKTKWLFLRFAEKYPAGEFYSPMHLEAGNYHLTVSYKTKGYRTVKEGKKTVEFAVMPA